MSGLELLPSGFYRARFRTGAGRVRIVLHVTSEPIARDRRDRLQTMVSSLVRAKLYSAASSLLEDGAKATDLRSFAAVEKAARVTLQEAATEARSKRKPTYRELAHGWLDGELAKQEPTIGKRCDGSARQIRRMFEKYVFPLLGDLPIDQIDADHLHKVRKAFAPLPSGRSIKSYCRLTLFVIRIANSPLQLRGPLPVDSEQFCKAVLPKHEFGWLYPSEEAAIVSSADEPWVYRLALGFMARNGTRGGETMKLQWEDFDLDAGHLVIPAHKTKTRKRRAFTLDPDVARALVAHRERERHAGRGRDSDRVFPFTPGTLREWMRAAMPRCGITRKELLVSTEYLHRLRLHDMRATFCTVGCNVGKSERELRDRTGHLTPSEFDRYVRQARTAPEREHGWFVALDLALAGQLPPVGSLKKAGHGVGQGAPDTQEMASNRVSRANAGRQETSAEPLDLPAKAGKRKGSKSASRRFGPPGSETVGQADPKLGHAGPPNQAAEIAQLRAQLEALQAALATGKTGSAPKRRRRR